MRAALTEGPRIYGADMTLFVYVTANCQSGAQVHGLTDELERFREKVESTQSGGMSGIAGAGTKDWRTFE